MQTRSTFVLLAVCWGVLVVPESAVSSPLPDHTLGLPPTTASEVELQRVATSPRGPSLTPSALSGDFSDAIYAGRLAKELVRLEQSRKPVYVNFIYSGFVDSEIPRDLPSDLQQLSRTAPSPIASPGPATPTSFSTSTIGDPSGGIFLGARGANPRPPAQVISVSPTAFPAQTFRPREIDRRAFVLDTRARGFPFARGAVRSFAK